MTNNNYCVILAGGKGRRLWPVSRAEYPKQFIDFFGVGRTQLQQTFDRLAKIIPADHILVNTNQTYADLVREQLPELPSQNLMAEPIYRNTAPSVAWAAHRTKFFCPNANLIVVPSDHAVQNEDLFKRDMLEGLEFVSNNDGLLTMGVKPTRPEPGYGYVQLGENVGNDLYKVQSFTEKPERDFARVFMESGEFLWNTGMFLSNVTYLRDFFIDVIKDMPYRMANLLTMESEEARNQYVAEHYPAYPNLSMDKAALEMSDNVYVMQCDFGWADLGTWHSLYEFMSHGTDENIILDSEVMTEDCKGNIIKLPKGHVGVINGLEGYIVAEEGDVLLICKKSDSSSLIRKYVNEIGIRYGEKYT